MTTIQSLTTDELIAECDWDAAVAARFSTSHASYMARQIRISRVVDELLGRASHNDQTALAWQGEGRP